MSILDNKGGVNHVACSVKNCVHHRDASEECTARSIKVGPTFAKSVDDTVCATYSPKSGRHEEQNFHDPIV